MHFGVKIDYFSRFLILIYLYLALFSSTSNAAKVCAGLNETLVNLNNGYFFPKNCSAKTVPLGTKCAIVCNKGYGWKESAKAVTECSLLSKNYAGWTGDSYIYQTKCDLLTRCPALDLETADYWNSHWCGRSKSRVGTVCQPNWCPFDRIIGVKEKVCQPNGTWTPIGGQYCNWKDFLPLSIECPGSLIYMKTTPGKRTADVRGRIPNPSSDYPESEMKMTAVEGLGKDHTIVPSTRVELKFLIKDNHSNRENWCRMRLRAVDKEPPLVYKCPEEIHYTVAEGLQRQIDFDLKKEIKIVDAVNSNYQPNIDSKNSTTYHGHSVPPGNWTVAHEMIDAEGNKAYCKIKIIVKSKPCKLNAVSTGSFPVVKGTSSRLRFYSDCKNGSHSLCNAWHYEKMRVDPTSCFVHPHYAGLKCETFLLKPLPSCVNDSSIADPVNGTCPNGTIVGHFFGRKPTKCFPCERGMFFNFTTNGCQLCPDNTTTYILGSNECVACPKNQMTKLSSAPRFCEDICNPGSWLDSSNQTCTKCPLGFYAAAGARRCTKCPGGLTTLAMESTNENDCVVGDAITQDSGFVKINAENITVDNATVYHYRINWNIHPLDQINELLAFQFNSSYLQQLSDCSKGYVRLYSIVNTIRFDLSENICGSTINSPLFVRVMKDSPAFVEFHFSDSKAAEVSFRFGIANCSLGYSFDFASLSCKPCPVNTFRLMHNERVCQKCQPGTAAPIEGSILCQDDCPKGTLRNGSICENCPIGYYQDETEKKMCKKCPNGTMTSQSRSEKAADCVVACAQGQYKSGNSCLPCPTGLYQNKPSHADRMCIFCPSKQTTIGKGATSCVAQCSYEGEYYDKGEGKCKKCPLGTYKIAKMPVDNQVDACTACPTNHTTKRLGAASITECVDTYDNCSPNPCKFPSRCQDTGTDFKCHCPHLYSGKYCETKLHVCEKNPCKNNATCYNYYVWSKKEYYCECLPGWTGKNCDVVYDACGSSPCYYGNCTRVGKTDFKCICPKWHTGKRCEYLMNKPCYSYPCLNRGTCVDEHVPNSTPKYHCKCSPGFTGRNCETRIDYCLNNKCNKTGSWYCRNGYGSYRCICKSYYRQTYCNESYGCDPGEYMVNEKCKKCLKGTYQINRNRNFPCLDCPTGKTTFKEGAVRYSDCVVLDSFTKLEMKLKITNVVWSNKLSDKTSAEFASLSSRWETAIKNLYKNESHFKSVVINGFSKGSVICDFTVYFETGVKDPKGQFEKGIESGSVEGFSVDKSSLKTDVTNGTKHKTLPKKKNYTLMAVLIVVGVLLVIGLITGYLLYTRNKERIRVRFDKMMSNNDTVSMDYPMSEKK